MYIHSNLTNIYRVLAIYLLGTLFGAEGPGAHRFSMKLEFKIKVALADVAQWIECQPANQRVSGSIPTQGTCLGCGPGPQWRALERQPYTDVSVPLFLPPFPSLKISKTFKTKTKMK